jgi:hypothetical protein
MASNEVLIRGVPGSKAKIRSPVWVVVWSVLTLGIYSWFWWYFINREMRDLGQARGTDELGDNPTLSALAVSLGALILVPPFVSFYGTGKRIKAAQRIALGREDYNGWVGLVLLIIWLAGITLFIPLQWGYMQSELNKVWKDPNVTDPAAPGLPHPGVAAPGAGVPQHPATTTQDPAAAGAPQTATTEQQPAADTAQEPATAQQDAPAAAPADWYPDPTGQARLRYWDGGAWTQHTAQ